MRPDPSHQQCTEEQCCVCPKLCTMSRSSLGSQPGPIHEAKLLLMQQLEPFSIKKTPNQAVLPIRVSLNLLQHTPTDAALQRSAVDASLTFSTELAKALQQLC